MMFLIKIVVLILIIMKSTILQDKNNKTDKLSLKIKI